jgi:hypothetical protein
VVVVVDKGGVDWEVRDLEELKVEEVYRACLHLCLVEEEDSSAVRVPYKRLL